MDGERQTEDHKDQGTLPQLLQAQAARYGTKTAAIREKAYGIWQTFSWEDYLRFVRQTALGLVALDCRRGETVVLITDNHPEWLFSEIGAQSLGAVTLNLFTSAVAEELSTSLNRVQATHVFVQNQEQVDKLIACRTNLGHVRKVIYIDPTGMSAYEENSWLLSYRQLLSLGEALERERPGAFQEMVDLGKPEDTALMIQTSGTTGLPKLAMLSHRNLTAIAESWIRAVGIRPGENWLSMSPPAWIVDQMWGLGVALLGGMAMNFPETPETVVEDFREIGPSRLITASRFWEELASKIRVRMADAGWLKRRLFGEAEKIGRARSGPANKKRTRSSPATGSASSGGNSRLSAASRPDRLRKFPQRLYGRASYQPRCDYLFPCHRTEPQAMLRVDRSRRHLSNPAG